MCGRFNWVMTAGMVMMVDDLGVPIVGPDRYNIAPTDSIPVIIETEGSRQTLEARWWLVPSWSDGPSQRYAMFNARSETLSTSRAYKHPFQKKRCIIPASSFIEWTKTDEGKQPYEITTKSGAMALAGLWDYWQGEEGEGVYSCTIVTTDAVTEFEHIHQRMPLILDREEQRRWLDIANEPDSLASIFSPRLREPFNIYPLSKDVNNSRNKSLPMRRS